MGPLGAYCFKTISNTEREVPKEQWDKERFGQICMHPDTYAEWKANALKLCEETGRCTFEQKKSLKEIDEKLAVFQERKKRAERQRK